MIDPAVRRRLVINRVSWRIIPFVFISYVVAYVDRVNIGFAANALERDLGLSHTQYGIGAGLFFLGYCLFEVPSNILLDKVGARRWIARIMIGWGIASMLTMFVRDVSTFYLARVILGIVALRVLTDRPEQAAWLPDDDREWLSRTMREERELRGKVGHVSIARSLASGRVWLLCLVYFLNTTVTYGIFLWLPKILADASGLSGYALSSLTSIPFVAALIAMVLVGRHSDKTGERKKHVAGCALTAATGLVLAVAFRDTTWLLVLSFALSQMGQRAVMSVFWAIPPMLLGGTAAAAGIGLINAVGNLGGFFGPSIMGTLRDATGGYSG